MLRKKLFFIMACVGLVIAITFTIWHKFSASNVSGNIFSTYAAVEKNAQSIIASSSYIKMNEDELYRYADVVVFGKVKSISDSKEVNRKFGDDERFVIYRDYVFEVKEVLKGSPENEVIIRVAGGEIGKRRFVSDEIKPDKEKDQILFLKEYNVAGTKDKTYTILGGPQGKYIIEENKAIGINTREMSEFLAEINGFKVKYGDKIVPPPGGLQ